MSTSLIYRSGTVYEVLMRGLYGRHYDGRFQPISALIPVGASVVDVCCGPATLFTKHLQEKSVDYRGLDLNEGFVAELARAGGRGEVWNVHADDPLPPADYLIMQASLYHFLPDPGPVIDRMLAAARTQVIIAEPVRNLATSDNRVLATIGRRFTNAGDGAQEARFTEPSLDAFFRRYGSRVSYRVLIAGGREKLYVLDV
ncbi:methionine biosynthesis protein MetW [Nocardia salmonicida]|uniref:class I SAM-dependent methyltransferase n=1 Tax=Nocardia salmonicida TaxID=53431 RepID=UPI0033EC9145